MFIKIQEKFNPVSQKYHSSCVRADTRNFAGSIKYTKEI